MIFSYLVTFDDDTWDMYQLYDGDWYILLPKSYTTQITNSAPDVISKAFGNLKLDKKEKVYGMHLSNLNKIDIDDAFNLFGQKNCKFFGISVVSVAKVLENLFVKKSEIKKQEKYPYPLIWNILVSGHGSFSVSPEQIQFLNQLRKLIDQERKRLEGLGTFKSSQILLSFVNGQIDMINKTLKDFSGFDGDIEVLITQKKLLESQKSIIDSLLKYIKNIQFILKQNNVAIAGMRFNYFQDMLNFLAEHVDVDVLSYLSCYAGDKNLLYPYISRYGFGEDVIYPYTITAGTVSDTVFSVKSALYYFYPKEQIEQENIIISTREERGEEVMFVSSWASFDFENYFEALKKEEGYKSLSDVLVFIYPEKPGFVFKTKKQRPVIRYSGQMAFVPVDISKHNEYLGRVKVSAIGIEGTKEVSYLKDIILGTYYLPISLHIYPFSTFVKHLPSLPLIQIIEPIYRLERVIYIKEIIVHQELFDVQHENTITIVANSLLNNAFNQHKGEDVGHISPKVVIVDKVVTDKQTVIAQNCMFTFNSPILAAIGMQDAQRGPDLNYWDALSQFPYFGDEKDYIETYLPVYEHIRSQIFNQAKKDNLELIDVSKLDIFLQQHKKQVKEKIKQEQTKIVEVEGIKKIDFVQKTFDVMYGVVAFVWDGIVSLV